MDTLRVLLIFVTFLHLVPWFYNVTTGPLSYLFRFPFSSYALNSSCYHFFPRRWLGKWDESSFSSWHIVQGRVKRNQWGRWGISFFSCKPRTVDAILWLWIGSDATDHYSTRTFLKHSSRKFFSGFTKHRLWLFGANRSFIVLKTNWCWTWNWWCTT